MRPGTGALPTRLLSPTRCNSPADLSPPHFSAPHFSAIPTLVSLRSRFSRGNHGDAYTPDAIPSPTPWDNRSHLSRPHLSAIHFSAIPTLVSLRSRFSRGDDGDGCIPDAIPSPTPWHNRSHLSRPHLSAIHFSAIPILVSLRSRFSRGNHGDAYTPDAIPSPTPWDNRSQSLPPPSFCHPFFCHSLFRLFSFFLLSPKFSVCQTGMARAFSPYLPRRAHFTWGVAPGWYRSGLWPLLSLFSDQCANGAPYTTLEQRPTKRPTPTVTFDDTRTECPFYHCRPFPDRCARGRARSRRRCFLQRAGSSAAIFHRLIFLPSIFLPFPLSPFSANLSGSSDRGVDRASPRLSAARRSAKPGTNAFISPRPFGCGCAALRSMVYGPWSIMSHAWLTENPS